VDLVSDARLLADYGPPPRHWILTPLYAWRVIKRRGELKAALVKRREECTRTTTETEDALAAFAERVRPAAEQQATYAPALKELRRAEEILRSRDKVLATEQDAQNARLSQVDARLTKLESDLAKAREEERTIAAELAASQGALARQEAKLKRAESELRMAQKTVVEGGAG
jgi:chromosome segregation ATPase